MGLEVTVIDDSDHVGTAAALTRAGEIYMKCVQTMVDNVLAHLRARAPYSRTCSPATRTHGSMSRLNILDHGNSSGVEIGTDWITPGTFGTFRPQLRRLAGRFDDEGFVHLQQCEVGQNIGLLQQFADVFGVPVVAGRGLHNPVYRANLGYYVRVHPANGRRRKTHETFFWRP